MSMWPRAEVTPLSGLTPHLAVPQGEKSGCIEPSHHGLCVFDGTEPDRCPLCHAGLHAGPCGSGAPAEAEVAEEDVVTTERRTSLVTMRNVATGHTDIIRLCDPHCRDVYLLDLGLKGSGGVAAFRSHGTTEVDAPNGARYALEWKRCRASALYCDQCGEEWRTRPLPPKRPLTEAQRAALAAGAKPFRVHG